jgi:NAD(P)-dependent dehydrogenase (short-subunit alcohol dehydrogenase family)
MKHLTVLTGASRGMGLAMARQLCTPDALLLCISRATSPELQSLATQKGATLLQWPADLAESAPVASRLLDWLVAQAAEALASATLINNAGIIGRIGPLDPMDTASIAATLRVDLEAPMQLTAAFLTATRDWDLPRRILNISSGLGRNAMAGSALYCAAKAGMDHYSRCVALDEAAHVNGARIVSLAPGVIDTDMQADLRAGDPAGFPGRATFVNLKETGALTSPADAAARLLNYLARPDFGSKPVADVRDPA